MWSDVYVNNRLCVWCVIAHERLVSQLLRSFAIAFQQLFIIASYKHMGNRFLFYWPCTLWLTICFCMKSALFDFHKFKSGCTIACHCFYQVLQVASGSRFKRWPTRRRSSLQVRVAKAVVFFNFQYMIYNLDACTIVGKCYMLFVLMIHIRFHFKFIDGACVYAHEQSGHALLWRSDTGDCDSSHVFHAKYFSYISMVACCIG